MYGICRRYVSERTEAEDVLHDGFVTLFTKIGEYRGEGSFEGWCRRIFVTSALSYLRRNKKMRQAEEIDQVVRFTDREASAVERMSAEELLSSIAELPDGYRTILNLYAIEGYSHQEVAGMMNISEATSRSQYSRARVRLLEILKKKENL